MSDYGAIADVGETLVDLLWDNMQNLNLITKKESIVLASPGEIPLNQDVQLSLFLYQILKNVHLTNQEMQIKDYSTLTFPPIALDLYYMLTAYPHGTHELTDMIRQEHKILGRAIQILNKNQTLLGSVLKGSLQGSGDEIHVMLTSMNLDDMTKIWTTFQGKPFRTSVCFLVTPVLIDSTSEIGVQRVISKETDYNIIVPKRAEK